MTKQELKECIEKEVMRNVPPLKMSNFKGFMKTLYIRYNTKYLSDEQSFLLIVRKMQYLWSKGTILSRLHSNYLHRKLRKEYGCCIHQNAAIGIGFHVPHPIGIVIGSKSIIGKNCTLYQGVTIGSSVDAGSHVAPQPEIGDNVMIYANSMLLGGVKISSNTVIGANSVVLTDTDGGLWVGTPAVKK